ncbi:MAG: RICIN domain-containing protein [Polyangiales bacterium]
MNNLPGLRGALTSSLLLATALGCAPVDGDPVDDTDAVTLALVNARTPSSNFSIVSIQVAGASTFRTGVLISNRMVLTSARWVGWSTRPADLTVQQTSTRGAVTTARGVRVNVHPNGLVAMIHLDAPLSIRGGTSGESQPLDLRTASQQHNLVVTCWAHTSPTAQGIVYQRVTATATATTVTQDAGNAQSLEDRDAGAVCLDVTHGGVLGMATRTSAGVTTLVPMRDVADWFDDMRVLEGVIATARARATLPGALFVEQSPVAAPGTYHCLDVPNGHSVNNLPVNQFRCHWQPAQQWYLHDPEGDGIFSLVSASSGKCLDMAAGTAEGAAFQQFRCHFGANQSFRASAWSQGAGSRIVRATAPGLCLSATARAGTLTDGVPVVQSACASGSSTANTHQRWGWNERL